MANKKLENIVFGGGCFWCSEAGFLVVPGVESVIPGYAGGWVDNPTYEQVSTGETGHAEVIKIEYDPEKVSLEKLLEIFVVVHNPTSLNRQGNDIGTQYRSIILWENLEQQELSKQFLAKIKKNYDTDIVTELKKLDKFYPAEQYHHRYFEKHQGEGYSNEVIAPKVEKVKRHLQS